MKTLFTNNRAQLPCSCCGLVNLRLTMLALLAVFSSTAAQATTTNSRFETVSSSHPLESARDEILLISTRTIGTTCNGQSMNRGLKCQRLHVNASGQASWQTSDWRRTLSQSPHLATIVYVHGNRVTPGRDRVDGMRVYQSFKNHHRSGVPIRFVIWSWPSSQIPGPIRDYLVKAKRTTPVAWQLAWWLDKLPPENQISLVGYSYGTRVISGATHLLAGGQLGNLKLGTRTYPQRLPVRTALLAAAFDADWIQPGQFYGRSLAVTEKLILTTNERDPAMRFYHLSNGRGRIHALGKSGVRQPQALGKSAHRLQRIDFTREVGRNHSLSDYLAASRKMGSLWSQLNPDADSEKPQWLSSANISALVH